MCVFMLFFLILGFILPYMHDDWDWGSIIGLNRLTTYFKGYNGRWAGNIFVILLTRSLGLRALLYSATMFFTVYLLCKIINRNDFFVFGISTIILLCMSHEMFAQVIAWTSGFTNYTLPMPFALLIMLVVKNKLFTKTMVEYSNIKRILICVACFIGMFFVEHLSFYLLCLTTSAFIIFKIRNKKFDPLLFILMLCSVIGVILMFCNPAYLEALYNDNNYQRVSLTKDFGYTFFNAIEKGRFIVYNLFIKQAVLSVTLCVLSIFLLYRSKPRFFINIIFILAIYVFYSFIRNRVPFLALDIYAVSIIEFFFGATAILCIIYSIYHIDELKWIGLFYTLSIFFASAPLLFVSPVSIRNLYTPYLFMTLLSLEIILFLFATQMKNNIKFFNRYIMLTGICCILFYTVIFTTVYYFNRERIMSHQTLINMSDTKLILYGLPFEDYMFYSTPMDERYILRYKIFYGLPENTDIVFEKREFMDPFELIKKRTRSIYNKYRYIAPD